jgi:hypothetical protein
MALNLLPQGTIVLSSELECHFASAYLQSHGDSFNLLDRENFDLHETIVN